MNIWTMLDMFMILLNLTANTCWILQSSFLLIHFLYITFLIFFYMQSHPQTLTGASCPPFRYLLYSRTLLNLNLEMHMHFHHQTCLLFGVCVTKDYPPLTSVLTLWLLFELHMCHNICELTGLWSTPSWLMAPTF